MRIESFGTAGGIYCKKAALQKKMANDVILNMSF